MLNLLVRRSLTAQEHDFHLQLHKWMRVVKAPIAQSFYSFRAPLQLEHLRTSWSKLILQLNFYQRFSKVSSCPARSISSRIVTVRCKPTGSKPALPPDWRSVIW